MNSQFSGANNFADGVADNFFGTDGVRGRANTHPIQADALVCLGQALGLWLRQQPRTRHDSTPTVLIGKDTRLSGYMIEQALASGLNSMGVRVLLTGPLPTPGIGFVAKNMRADAGVVISASHNPYHDNGLKFFGPDGFKFSNTFEKQIQSLFKQAPFHTGPTSGGLATGGHATGGHATGGHATGGHATGGHATGGPVAESLVAGGLAAVGHVAGGLAAGDRIGRTRRVDDALGRYIVHIKNTFPLKYDLCGLKIVVDCANGAAYRVAPLVLEELGAQVIVLSNSPNGRNINANCGALHPQNMCQAVVQHQAHMGIALDGDADRCILADEKGQLVGGDPVLAILADQYHLHKGSAQLDGCTKATQIENGNDNSNRNGNDNDNTRQNKQAKKKSHPLSVLVGTHMSNVGLENFCHSRGLQFVRTAVGDKYVVEYLKKHHLTLGGEPSGHIIQLQHSTTGDGLVGALGVLAAMQQHKQKLSQLRQLVTEVPQTLVNIKVDKKTPLDQVPGYNRCVEEVQQQLGREGRVYVRYSGTENVLRILIESPEAKLNTTLAQKIAKLF